MTTLANLENKVAFLEKQLRILKKYRNLSLDQILQDEEKIGAVERYLYLACQSTIDLADLVISLRKMRRPTSLSDHFYVLQEENFISLKLSEQLVKMTGFRNILAHGYEKVNYNILYDVLNVRLEDAENFLIVVKNKFNL